jgi:hypothetical protein
LLVQRSASDRLLLPRSPWTISPGRPAEPGSGYG